MTFFLHLGLSCAMLLTLLQFRPMAARSSDTVLLHVVFERSAPNQEVRSSNPVMPPILCPLKRHFTPHFAQYTSLVNCRSPGGARRDVMKARRRPLDRERWKSTDDPVLSQILALPHTWCDPGTCAVSGLIRRSGTLEIPSSDGVMYLAGSCVYGLTPGLCTHYCTSHGEGAREASLD
ncbi:hypothetical protein Bbelb_296310 [Branchiostoma belcheri]|nr:hypothetical protein Bbelb_296310 [Branchiostoma belcheri]